MAWQQLPLDVTPVLPGAFPVLQWLSEERGLPFVPPPVVAPANAPAN
jgi:8-oxo-dGTP diphosphatase